MKTLLLSLLLICQPVPDNDSTILTKNFLQARTERCWTQDRMSNKDLISVSATGAGFFAYAVAAERELIKPETARSWILRGFDSIVSYNNPSNGGWLYHFMDRKGNPKGEVSSVDTTLFFLFAEKAANKLNDDELLKYIQKKKKEIQISVCYNDKEKLFYHTPKRKHAWNKYYDESVLIYKYFDKLPPKVEFRSDLPLFVYYYPLAFYKNPMWKSHLQSAVNFQLNNTKNCGYTSCDTKWGYQINSPYFISPLASYCAEAALHEESDQEDRLIQSISLDGSWKSTDRILLDDGILLLLLDSDIGFPKPPFDKNKKYFMPTITPPKKDHK